MNMEQFREAMASSATKENEDLKRKIKELEAKNELLGHELSEKNNRISIMKSDCKALSNRCFVHTQGAMCMFCRLNGYVCEHSLQAFIEKKKGGAENGNT